MAIAKADTAHDTTAARDKSPTAVGDNDLSTATANRFRDELGSIFGKPPVQDSTKFAKAETPTKNDAGDRTPDKLGDKPFNDFARTNGLDTRNTPDGKVEFSLKNNGEKLTIGTVDKTREGFKEIDRTLKEMTSLKQLELENKFGVKFAQPGDPKPRQASDPGSKPGKELEVRSPKLKELLGIEAALDKANPSHATGDSGKAVKFYFLKNQSFEPSAKGVAAFEPDVHGNPAVIVDPNSLDKTPITERDRDTKRDGPHRSIESVMIHELGHHSEEKVFKNPTEKADFYKGMGWSPVPGSKPEENQWMMNGRDGRGYAPGGPTPHSNWQRIDDKGRVTGEVSPDRVERLAQVKPATNYFTGPHEMLAEGLTMLRLGDSHRTQLMQTDNKLYGMMKGIDQKEIDMTHGPGKFMRSYDGKLQPRSAEAEKALLEREEAARARKPGTK